MPANTNALVAKAAPGEELACRAFSFQVRREGDLERGVTSYYAFESLLHARQLSDWLGRIREAVDLDVREEYLSPLQTPSLQILGNDSAAAPGQPPGGGGLA